MTDQRCGSLTGDDSQCPRPSGPYHSWRHLRHEIGYGPVSDTGSIPPSRFVAEHFYCVHCLALRRVPLD